VTRLLCTDLDRTLLPNGEQPESPLARPILWQLLRHHDVSLAYVSGRDLQRVQAAIDDYELPIPDVIVADVGTSVYVRGTDGWQLDGSWQALIGDSWNNLDSDGIRSILTSFDDLQNQEADRQTRYKRSYYLSLQTDASTLTGQLDERLRAHGVQAALVFSEDPLKGVRLLDVLPQLATKKQAITHVGKLLGIDPSSILFSGDSGNDVTALASELPSVTVRNADADTRRAVQDLAATNGTLANTYQAEGGVSVAGGRILNGHYAAGIVEGLLHFNERWADDLMRPDWVQAAQMARQFAAAGK
jgi:sucrose-6F-phosphate phosphohydrolase